MIHQDEALLTEHCQSCLVVLVPKVLGRLDIVCQASTIKPSDSPLKTKRNGRCSSLEPSVGEHMCSGRGPVVLGLRSSAQILHAAL